MISLCYARTLGSAEFLISFRGPLCCFVDRLFAGERKSDPQNHTKKREDSNSLKNLSANFSEPMRGRMKKLSCLWFSTPTLSPVQTVAHSPPRYPTDGTTR